MATARLCLQHYRRFSSSLSSTPQVAIVGSGPAGYYTAQQILKGNVSALVDIYEKLPIPFGLVRFGIAPDHPEVKNVVNAFTQISKNDRCCFVGNVSVGQDVTVEELRKNYTAVVLAYGADDDKLLSVPGENMKNVLSARSFVGWYNGLPQDRNLQPNLDTETAVVFGHGNVAIDVARVLLSPVDSLRSTDITEYAMEVLSRSRVRRVHLIGRRGPLQVAFTPAELREMVKLAGSRPVLKPEDFVDVKEKLNEIPRSRKRLTELMLKTALEHPSSEDAQKWSKANKEFHLNFLRSPIRFLPTAENLSDVGSVCLSINRLQERTGGGFHAIPTGLEETMSCGLVLRSIGYRSHRLDATMPFDESSGVMPNKLGRVEGQRGLYCSGWVKRGPVGVLGTTMNDAFETGKIVVDDLAGGTLPRVTDGGRQCVLEKLRRLGITTTSFVDWEKIDAAEVRRGESKGKCREKICDVNEMLAIAKQ